MRTRNLSLVTRRVAYATSLSLAIGCSLQDFDPLTGGIDSAGSGGDGVEPGGGGDGGSGSNGGSGSGSGGNGGSAGDGGSAGSEAGQGGSAGTGGGGNGGSAGGPTFPAELMTDPSFETGLSGWQPFGSATLARVQTETNTGDYSVLCSNRADEWMGATFTLPPLTNPDAFYTVSVWLRLRGPEVDGGAAPSANIVLTLKTKCEGDMDDTAGELYEVIGSAQVTDEWILITGNTTKPNRCAANDLRLLEYRVSIGEPQGPLVWPDFYMDDISVVRKL
jgi:hypothetical protein